MLARVRDQLLVLMLLALGWQWLALWLQAPLLPTPLAVLEQIQQLAGQGTLWPHLLVTLRREALSFMIAIALGALLGVALGRSDRFNRCADPLLVLLLNIPALVLIILLYVWFGLVEAAAVLAVVLNKLPNVAVTLREGSRSLDPQLEQMADAYQFPARQRWLHVWWPQLFPYLMVAMRSGLALIWKIVLVVELLGRSDGVGFQLHLAFQLFDVTAILAWSFAFIAVVQLIEWGLLQPLEQHARRWQQEGHHAPL